MRIAIDARKLRDFGIGTYIRNILIELFDAKSLLWQSFCFTDDFDLFCKYTSTPTFSHKAFRGIALHGQH